jgi:DNA-directed RNA polymerase subunit L
MVRLEDIPIIQIDWDYFIELDEMYVEDLTPFSIILLTLIKDEEVQLVAYDIEEKKWSLLH